MAKRASNNRFSDFSIQVLKKGLTHILLHVKLHYSQDIACYETEFCR